MQPHHNKVNDLTGIPRKKDACIVIINTEWNEDIVGPLTNSALQSLNNSGVTNVKIYTVPGAVELPFAVKKVWQNKKEAIDAFIVFGCVIKGGTPHFDYVCNMVSEGINMLNIQLPIPTIFGVLTVDYKEQAIDRIQNGKVGDKGAEAAHTVLKMINFSENI